jgi:hypothetical protein
MKLHMLHRPVQYVAKFLALNLKLEVPEGY